MRFLLIGLLAVGLAALPGEAQNVIKLGNLVDLTGPTSLQLPRGLRIHEQDADLPQLRKGNGEEPEPQAARGVDLRRQRVRAGPDRGRASVLEGDRRGPGR